MWAKKTVWFSPSDSLPWVQTHSPLVINWNGKRMWLKLQQKTLTAYEHPVLTFFGYISRPGFISQIRNDYEGNVWLFILRKKNMAKCPIIYRVCADIIFPPENAPSVRLSGETCCNTACVANAFSRGNCETGSKANDYRLKLKALGLDSDS